MTSRTTSHAGSWIAVLAFIGAIVAPPAAHAAQVGYDILFTCDDDCTTGVNEPTGTLFLDESALRSDGIKSLVNDAGGTLMISFMGYDWDEADDSDATTFPEITITSGEVVEINFLSLAQPGLSLNLRNNGWVLDVYVGCPFGVCGLIPHGTFTLARQPTTAVPEPHAAILFGVGSLVVGSRMRRRGRN